MLGHKRIPSREGGVEIVVEEPIVFKTSFWLCEKGKKRPWRKNFFPDSFFKTEAVVL